MTEQPTTAGDLAELVKALADQRFLTDLAKGVLKVAEAELAKVPQWQTVAASQDDLRAKQATVGALEAQVRAVALGVAAREGTMNPAPGLQVVLKRTFEITDLVAATAWARTNMPMTLTLEPKAFEKLVTALPAAEVAAVPGIQLSIGQQVRISTKLDDFYPTGPAA